jgi:hypothetical protein
MTPIRSSSYRDKVMESVSSSTLFYRLPVNEKHVGIILPEVKPNMKAKQHEMIKIEMRRTAPTSPSREQGVPTQVWQSFADRH